VYTFITGSVLRLMKLRFTQLHETGYTVDDCIVSINGVAKIGCFLRHIVKPSEPLQQERPDSRIFLQLVRSCQMIA